MQGMTPEEHERYDAVRAYLDEYRKAVEYEQLCLNERNVQGEALSAFNARQSIIVDEIKGKSLAAIDLLRVGLGRTIVEMRHIDLYGWRYIEKKTQMCRTTIYKYYRDAIFDLYQKMIDANLI